MINEPKYKVGDRLIPVGIDAEEYPTGYVVGFIQYDTEDIWVYWGYRDDRYAGIVIGPGFAEKYVTKVEE